MIEMKALHLRPVRIESALALLDMKQFFGLSGELQRPHRVDDEGQSREGGDDAVLLIGNQLEGKYALRCSHLEHLPDEFRNSIMGWDNIYLKPLSGQVLILSLRIRGRSRQRTRVYDVAVPFG
jgi:hypothetical protein